MRYILVQHTFYVLRYYRVEKYCHVVINVNGNVVVTFGISFISNLSSHPKDTDKCFNHKTCYCQKINYNYVGSNITSVKH